MLRFALILLACPAIADTPMNASEFEAFSKGRTLTFGIDGENYGVERYLPGRRVIWSFLDGQCEQGYWYEENTSICFVYDFEPEPQCWQMFETATGIRTIFMNDPQTTATYQISEDQEPLICNGLGA